ncbi:MAG: hypothetical protein HQL31_03990 [Planctomycetes bacterium]|nr:hypothetical protein [Planctomycetota bacterium]
MPLMSEGKILLDSGKSIDTESMLNLVKSSGVRLIDVSSAHMEELAAQYPEFYGFHQKKLQAARSTGRQRRIQSADFIVKARELSPKPPFISVCAKNGREMDMKSQLVPYFRLEVVANTLNRTLEGIGKSDLVVIHQDDFTTDSLFQFRQQVNERSPGVKMLFVQNDQPPSKDASALVRFQPDYNYLLEACYFCLYPEHWSTLRLAGVVGMRIRGLKCRLLDIIADDSLQDEIELLSDKIGHACIYPWKAQAYVYDSQSSLTILRTLNNEQSLISDIEALRKKGANLSRLLVVTSHITKEEIAPLKAIKVGGVILGDLANEKTAVVLNKFFPAPQ